MKEFLYRFRFKWGPVRLVKVTSARRFRLPTPVLNRYPGCWIGIALYFHQRGLSFLWGRPGGIKD